MIDNESDDFVLPPLTDIKAVVGEPLKKDIKKAAYEDIVAAVKAVQDPELMINVYDLGLIYKIEQKENGDVFVLMTLTAPTCPMAGEMPLMVASAIASVVGVGIIEVQLTFDPPWTVDRINEDLKILLGL